MAADASDACVSFRLSKEGFGLPLDQVREIAAAGRIAPVPLAPPVIRGLASVRGHVVTLIDVATVFGRALPPARCAEERLALILCSPWEHLGIYVHAPVEIGRHATAVPQGETLRALAMAGAPSPSWASVERARRAPEAGRAAVSDDFVHLLSARDLVAFCEARVLEGFRRRS